MRKDRYTQGYSDAVTALHGKRTVQSHASFLLPYLKPGLRVLDCGCGPGSITLGIAQKVDPGEVIGIEVEDSQLTIARKKAVEKSITNVRFEHASVYELPYESASFDIVFFSAVLGNLNFPDKALLEARRVLKDDSLLAIREFDFTGNLLYPEDSLIQKSFELWFNLRKHYGQPPYGIGRLLKEIVKKAGFKDPFISASYEVFVDNHDTEFCASVFANLILGAWKKALLELSLTSNSEMIQMVDAWRLFGEKSNAFLAIAWCEALVWKRNG
ncbi:class I SAM-dependent methyltransferase [Xanthovirga aplysinae]|uniref:class I SAM-dependent methyltransferase n=1 Tax=Xanthovirga aplysinae TaxID=2529853 RepID=UPI0012BC2946|nr:methyltransferase domain-containing protein [Xanthovirga aplysinae]MTI33234.1 methyltransferase domain-containing protein [Xanthovirga aplysinae]